MRSLTLNSSFLPFFPIVPNVSCYVWDTWNKVKELLLLLEFSELIDVQTHGIISLDPSILKCWHKKLLAKENR